MFRKESQTERNNQIPEKSSKTCDDPDIIALLKDSDDRIVNENNGPPDVTPPTSQSDISAPAPVPRPLVPPGFRTVLEKNTVTKPLVPHPPSEVGSIELQDKCSGISDNQGKIPRRIEGGGTTKTGDRLGSPRIPLFGQKPAIFFGKGGSGTKMGDYLGSPRIPFLAYPNWFGTKGLEEEESKIPAASVDPNSQKYGMQAVHTHISSIGEKMTCLSDVYVFDGGVGAIRPSSEASNQLRQAYKTQQSVVVADFVKENTQVHEILGPIGQARSGSILEKLFGGATAKRNHQKSYHLTNLKTCFH